MFLICITTTSPCCFYFLPGWGTASSSFLIYYSCPLVHFPHGCLSECTRINQSMPISLSSPSLPAALSITPVLLLACRAHHHLALVPATVVSSSSRMPSSFPPWQSFVSLARSSSCVLVISSLFSLNSASTSFPEREHSFLTTVGKASSPLFFKIHLPTYFLFASSHLLF